MLLQKYFLTIEKTNKLYLNYSEIAIKCVQAVLKLQQHNVLTVTLPSLKTTFLSI